MGLNDGTIMLENVSIVKRNFAGKEGPFNDEGERNFLVLLDPDIAAQMHDDGWLVKQFAPNPETGERQSFVQVKVFFPLYPPRIIMISNRGRTQIKEDEVELLDKVDVKNVDLILRPNNWSINGNKGKKAYLKTMYITIEDDPKEDHLANKYADSE